MQSNQRKAGGGTKPNFWEFSRIGGSSRNECRRLKLQLASARNRAGWSPIHTGRADAKRNWLGKEIDQARTRRHGQYHGESCGRAVSGRSADGSGEGLPRRLRMPRSPSTLTVNRRPSRFLPVWTQFPIWRFAATSLKSAPKRAYAS